MRSWQILHYARKHLGRSALYAIFGKRNGRIVELWCEDPMYTDKSEDAYDPIMGVKNLLTALDDQGHCGTVRACIDFLVAGTSLGCGQTPEIIELQPTINEELLADYAAVALLQEGIAHELEPHIIKARKDAAIAELERTYAKYREDFRS